EFDRIPHLVAGFEDLNGDKLSPRIPTRQLGAIDVVLDPDGKLRRNLLSIRTQDRLPQASFALRLSLLYLRHEAIDPHSLDSERGWFQFGATRLRPLPASGGGYVRALQQGYNIPLIYQHPLRQFPRATLSQVLNDRMDANLFRDRVVIIGTAAPRFSYAFETPLTDTASNTTDPRHTLPDLWVQAQATQQLLTIALEGKGMMSSVPDGLEAIGVILWAGVGTIVNAKIYRYWKQRHDHHQMWRIILVSTIGVTVAGSLITLGVGWGLMAIGLWLPVAGMVGGLSAGAVGFSVLKARQIHEQQTDLAVILDTTLQHAELIEGQLVNDRDQYHTESTLKSQQILDAMPVGVTLFNARGMLEYANDRARSLLGEQILSQPLTVGDFTTVCQVYDPKTNQPCSAERLPVTLALNGKASYVQNLEIRSTSMPSLEAGTPKRDIAPGLEPIESSASPPFSPSPAAPTYRIPIEGWGQPIYNLQGSIQHAIFVFQDTIRQEEAWNERLRLTADLEAKNQELQEADRLKDEFLKRTTHELRTPLNGIIGSLQIVLDDLCDDRFEERELLDQAHQSALHLFEIVNDILDFSRIKSGHVVLDLRSVDLHACLTQSLYLQLSNLRQKKLKLIKKYTDDSITVLADPIRLKQVLINTIGNAVKFTDQGSISIQTSIEIRPQPSGEPQAYGIVEILDTGIGVDPQIQPKLFEAFVMADGSSTRRYGGSGLGLTICRHLLALMNGTIELNSDGRDCGTVVRLSIPLAPEDSPADPLVV
ncbi:MAG: CHASE2 domain-containing protein, partial [Oscillatoriales cyanobacterium]